MLDKECIKLYALIISLSGLSCDEPYSTINNHSHVEISVLKDP